MFLSTNNLSIVYTFSWEYISISSHIVVCPLFNITNQNATNSSIWSIHRTLSDWLVGFYGIYTIVGH